MVRDIKFSSQQKFLDAAELLIRRRGLFNMLPDKVLSVSDEQYSALMDAGLITENGNEGRPSGSKTKAKKSSRVAG